MVSNNTWNQLGEYGFRYQSVINQKRMRNLDSRNINGCIGINCVKGDVMLEDGKNYSIIFANVKEEGCGALKKGDIMWRLLDSLDDVWGEGNPGPILLSNQIESSEEDVGELYTGDENLDLTSSSLKSSAGVNINLNIDIVKIVELLRNQSDNRASFTKAVRNQLKYETGGANIVVFNLAQDYSITPDPALPGKKGRYHNIFFDDVFWGVWVFCEAATFINKGDGGFINWAFSGRWHRHGTRVDFVRRSNCSI